MTYSNCFSDIKTLEFGCQFFPVFVRRMAQEGINQHHTVSSSAPIALHQRFHVEEYLFKAITLSALANLPTTVSSKSGSRLICAKTILNPYRYTPTPGVSFFTVDEDEPDAVFEFEGPTAGPGAKRWSASTRRLRMEVAGRQTFKREFGEERIWTTCVR